MSNTNSSPQQPIPSSKSMPSHSSETSREFNDPKLIEELLMNIPREPTPEYSINSYVNCYCGDPSPIQMAWTLKNPGRRFYGCHKFMTRKCGFFGWIDNEMEPCEKVYDFYLKIEDFKREIERLRNIANIKEYKNKELQKVNQMLEMRLKMEQQKNEFSVKKWICLFIIFFVVHFLIKVVY